MELRITEPGDNRPITLNPEGWPRPRGYANGMMGRGTVLVTGGNGAPNMAPFTFPLEALVGKARNFRRIPTTCLCSQFWIERCEIVETLKNLMV